MFIKIEKLFQFLNHIDIPECYLLNKEFARSFIKSQLVILCPLYPAGEKKDFNYNEIKFAKLISKMSKTQVIIAKNQIELSKYFGKNLTDNELIIGMGAGLISKWMRQLKKIMNFDKVLIEKFKNNLSNI